MDHPTSESPDPMSTIEPAPDSLSAAVARFRSCRWRRAAEATAPECCSHRDVLPITGTGGFDPEAWCPDCGLFKLKRTPRRRDDDYYQY